MGSRDDTTPHHQPLLSSLVVRPSDSGGGGGGSDYEPGEVRRDHRPPYSRSDRYADEPAFLVAWRKNVDLEEGLISGNTGFEMGWGSFPFWGLNGYRARATSISPVRRREIDRRYSPELDRLGDIPPRHRGGFGGGGRDSMRSPPRYRDYSPPRSRGRGGGGRPFGRGFDGPGYGGPGGPVRGESGMHRNNPNVRPREGDWYCSDPMCGNLNFARREYCNNCKKHRYGPGGSPRRGYGGPPPAMGPPRRFPGPPPMDRSPGRFMNGRTPPPRGWPRDAPPRDFGPGGPPPPRFADHHHMRRDRPEYPEEDYRDHRGSKFGPEWAPREHHGRDSFMDRKGYDRRPISPLPPPSRGRWADRGGDIVRERSRSPMRGGAGGGPPHKEFRRDGYMDRGRDDRRGVGPDRIGNVY